MWNSKQVLRTVGLDSGRNDSKTNVRGVAKEYGYLPVPMVLQKNA